MWLRRLVAAPLGVAMAALALVGCGGDDRGLHNELQAFPPGADSLPAGYSVAATEDPDLGQPLHNNPGATYVLANEDDAGLDARVTIVTFTHRDAVASYLSTQQAAGDLRGLMDSDAERGTLFNPEGREGVACVEGEHDDGAIERVCAAAVERTLVISVVVAEDEDELPATAFDLSLVEAGRTHALGLLAEE